MEPRVSKRNRKLHLSYERPHRIHCSAIYPLQAPSGSDVILYGHDRGLTILWRGGRRRRESHPTTNGVKKREQHDTGYDEEDKQDGDSQYLAIIQHIDLPVDSPVLQLAVPPISPASAPQLPTFVREHLLVAVACADSTTKLWSVPLEQPTDTEKEREQVKIESLALPGDGSIVNSLSCKLLSHSDEHRLVVAGAGSTVQSWVVGPFSDSLGDSFHQRTLSRQTGLCVAFAPPSSSDLLQVYDRSGSVRLYSLFKAGDSNAEDDFPLVTSPGQWLMSYHTPFTTSKDSSGRRKRILASAWVLSGRGILVLLEDGEWGVWEIDGRSGRSVEDFALRGYLESSSGDIADSSRQRRDTTKLAPMTPNTRKSKSENLFSRPAKGLVPGTAPSGGISVTTTTNRSGSSDESVLIWHNNEIYSLPSMQACWQRNNTGGAGSLGSLHAPGLTHITDINLMNEQITGLGQFATESAGSSSKQNLLVAAEHRFIILQHLVSPHTKSSLFQQAAAPSTVQDQRMLDVGELDIGGMDRLLDSMAGPRSRKVGFVS